MPGVRFDIGRYQGAIGCKLTELLGWFNVDGDRILSAEEYAEKLAARLRELGEDPNEFQFIYVLEPTVSTDG